MVMLVSLPSNELIPQTDPEIIKLKLLVWEDDDEVHFVYAPTASVVFKTNAPQKLVEIDLVHADETGSTDDPSFWISHYTASRMKAVKTVTIHKKKPGSGNSLESVAHPDKKHSQLGNDVDGKIKRFNLEVNLAPGASFYLNLVIKKKGEQERLISCDPQVENGSKT
jgi:uncharacterized cupredoxin-like copper-binding protein